MYTTIQNTYFMTESVLFVYNGVLLNIFGSFNCFGLYLVPLVCICSTSVVFPTSFSQNNYKYNDPVIIASKNQYFFEDIIIFN